jgi:serine/threonine-protein kinase
MGTPEYMAPEQLYAANRVDHRADIYSLGTMLYEMLSGERPANGDDAAQIVAQVASGQIQRVDEREPTVPKGLADVVHTAIESDKTRRYASAMEMRLKLSEFAGPLSHAGRLAAMAVPVGSMPQPESPAPTVDTPPLSAARNVPATLPPVDEESAAPASHAAAHGAPATIGAGKAAGAPATVSAMQVPGSPYSSPPRPDLPVKGATQEAPHGFAPFAQSAMPTPPPNAVTGYIPYPTIATPPRRPRRMLGAIFALMLGITVAGGLIAGIVYMRSQSDAEPGASQSLPPPSTTLTAQEQPTLESPPAAPRPPQSEPTVHPGARPGGTGKPRTDGTGKDGGAAGGQTGQFPFPVPSGFPPIPSGFPQFPFPFPPPAPSK